MNGVGIAIALLPENLLLAGIVLLLILDVAGAPRRNALPLALVTLVAGAGAALWLAATGYTLDAFPQQLSVDPEALAAKAIVLGLALPVGLMARGEFADDRAQGQFPVLLLSSLYGVCLLLSADSFLTLFVGLELMSLPVYALVLLAWHRPESAEAALKYLVLGGTATATLLMGASLLYGNGGSLALSTFADALGSTDALARTAVVLVIVAFFLKAAVVPFHAWAPDAYEASSVPVTAYMAVLVKAGVVLAAVRMFGGANVAAPLAGLIALLPLISIAWGNLAAMRQASFRRMIAYSSIAHAGYLFYAFLGDAPTRFQAVAFYVLAYGLMNLLAFACLPTDDDDTARDRLANLDGLFHRQPYAASLIAVAMLSLAGIPPFPGFVAKFLIFRNVIAAGYTLYAVLGLVGSYLGIYFYLRVVQRMFMTPRAAPAAAGPSHAWAMGASALCAVAVVVATVFPGWIIARL
jgi:NADH-quinone oxidoreductase subunit N